MRADSLPDLSGATVVCIQAGNVNTGPSIRRERFARRLATRARGYTLTGLSDLVAAASPRLAHLTAGFAEADSWRPTRISG